MTAYVNENCIGCGMCASICPEVFQMTDENVALADDVLPEQEDATKEAAQSCPVNAIEIGNIGLE